MKKIILIAIASLLMNFNIQAETVGEIQVFKSERKLVLLRKDQSLIKTYKISLGRNPIGDKEFEGDNKTPEGEYTLDVAVEKSQFYKAFHISYPNFKDKLKARFKGHSPGGDVMLHGMPNALDQLKIWLETVGLNGLSEENVRENLIQYDWTWGCIAVTNADMDEIFENVKVGTKIIIHP